MSYEHPTGEKFGGSIGKTAYGSEPWWPELRVARGKPNMVVVVLDDSGFALYVREGRLHFDYNCFHDHTLVSADAPLAGGRHTIEARVVRGTEREGDVTLSVDGVQVATGRVPRLVGRLSSTGMDLGQALAPINRDYDPPFAYPGRIARVIFELPTRVSRRDQKEEADREARAAMARK